MPGVLLRLAAGDRLRRGGQRAGCPDRDGGARHGGPDARRRGHRRRPSAANPAKPLDQVIDEGEQAGDAYLRVILAEQARAGLGDLVREKLPNALEVQLDEAHRPRPGTHGDGNKTSRAGRTPLQLFGDYLKEQDVADERVERMFAELLDQMTDGQPAS